MSTAPLRPVCGRGSTPTRTAGENLLRAEPAAVAAQTRWVARGAGVEVGDSMVQAPLRHRGSRSGGHRSGGWQYYWLLVRAVGQPRDKTDYTVYLSSLQNTAVFM
jgi:hypothetical protein